MKNILNKNVLNIRLVILIVAVTMASFHLYTGYFGVLDAFMQRIIHFSFAVSLGLAMWFEATNKIREKLGMAILFLMAIPSMGYLIMNYEWVMWVRHPFATDVTILENILALMVLIVIISLVYRYVGLPLFIVTLTFIIYAFIGPYLPGVFWHNGFKLSTVLETIYLTPEGVFGLPMGISATYIVLFLIFGAFLEKSGFGEFLIEISTSIAGRSRGGAAKIAVIASALFGSISGVAVANVVATGVFTIPMMKRLGYRKEFAGAVEAAASSGGQIMPPVMGVQAFLMAEYTGIPYITIVKYAIFPALLYFIAVGMMVHLEAVKTNLKGVSADELPDWKNSLRRKGHLCLPLVLLVWLLIKGFTPMYAVAYSILALVAISYLRKETMMTPKKIVEALVLGSKNSVAVAVASACAGIIVGMVAVTGLGMRFSMSIISLSGGNIYLGLILSMVAGIILGMGIPTAPAYILMVALIVPALVKLGVTLVAAHLFCGYFACISMITPPVALAAYAAAAIAGGNIMQTGWEAMKLGASAFIVPFMFVFSPALLLMGEVSTIVLVIITSLMGVLMLSCGIQGYIITKANFIERLLCFLAAITLIGSGTKMNIIGIVCIFLIAYMQRKKISSSKYAVVDS